MAFEHTGFWQPMDTLREKNLLQELWANGKHLENLGMTSAHLDYKFLARQACPAYRPYRIPKAGGLRYGFTAWVRMLLV